MIPTKFYDKYGWVKDPLSSINNPCLENVNKNI